MAGMLLDCDKGINKATAYGSEYGSGVDRERVYVCDESATVLGSFEDGKTSLALKEVDGCKCVFSSIGNLDGNILRQIATLAGVHIYSADCPVYVNSEVIGLYLDNDKSAIVNLPEDGAYKDAFTGKLYKSLNKQIKVPFGDYRSVMLIKE